MVFLTTIAAAVLYHYYRQYDAFLQVPVFASDTVVKIDKGQNFKQFIQNLHKLNANGKDWQWRLFAKMKKVGAWLTVGEFKIDANTTPMQMMQKIKANQVIHYSFTIIEGTNWRELKAKLLANPILVHSLNDIDEEKLLTVLGSDKQVLEGLFLPETYQFTRGDSDVDVLKRAFQALQSGLQQQWNSRKAHLPYLNPYEMLTMASIVEKETAQAAERDIIAGVFVRRLQKNMRLQTDPTVIYGMGLNYSGDIRSKDLSTDTPYNTYTRKGLPPTPIAMASIESIIASAHPKDGKALYFVANNRGGHFFSDTYEQHQKAVKDFLKGKKL